MKNTIVISLLFFTVTIFSQKSPVILSEGGVISKSSFLNGGIINNPSNDLVGSSYLFDSWENTNFVHLNNASKGNETAKLQNVNFNVVDNRFSTKIGNNKVFNFNHDYFDYVIINNRRFETFFDPKTNKNRIYEVIGNIGDKKFIKSFSTFIVKGKVSSYQTSVPVDKLKIKSQYFIKDKNNFIEFKPKKKTILDLLSDKREEIISYVKKEKLSFKKEKDLSKMFMHYNTL